MAGLLDRISGRLAQRGSAILVLVTLIIFWPRTAKAQSYDNMYKTANTSWNCTDLGSSTPSSSLFCQTDNSSLTWYPEDSIDGLSASTIYGVLYYEFDAPTDLVTLEESTPVYSGSSETDIIYTIRSDIPIGFIGWTWCDDAVNGTHCDQHYVAFLSNGYINYELACHETGHAVGLTHGGNASPVQSNTATSLGCMRTPESSGGDLGLGSYNQSEINATY